MEKKENEILNNFLLNIDCLDELKKWTDPLNIFDVLGLARAEIRHSNMLAWLFDPLEKHGLNDGLIQGVLKLYVKKYAIDDGFSIDNNADLLLNRDYNIRVYREYRNIDLLIVNETPNNKFVIAIENKIGTQEHLFADTDHSQLREYQKIVEEEYSKEYRHIYIYLSPDFNDEASIPEWKKYTYNDFLEIIEKEFDKNYKIMLPEAKVLISDYINIVKRSVIMDSNLTAICDKIYKQYKQAIDLIIDNKTDVVSTMSSKLLQVVKDIEATSFKDVIVTDDNNSKTIVRFRTKQLDSFLGHAEKDNGPWHNSDSYYYYELKLWKDYKEDKEVCYIRPSFAFGNKGYANDSDIMKKMNAIHKAETKKTIGDTSSWSWKTLKSLTKKYFVPEDNDLTEKLKKWLEENVFEEFEKWESKILYESKQYLSCC